MMVSGRLFSKLFSKNVNLYSFRKSQSARLELENRARVLQESERHSLCFVHGVLFVQ